MHHATFTESFRRIRAHVAAPELPVTEQVTRVGVPELRRLATHTPDAQLWPGLRIAGGRPAGPARHRDRGRALRRAAPSPPGRPARPALPPGCRVPYIWLYQITKPCAGVAGLARWEGAQSVAKPRDAHNPLIGGGGGGAAAA